MTSVLGEKLREALEKKSIESENSVLATTLKHWDDEDNTGQHLKDTPVRTVVVPVTKEKSNASRITFDFVRDNSGMYTVFEIANMLEAQGQKKSTVLSLLYQMLRSGSMRKTDRERISTVTAEYTPIKNTTYARKVEQKKTQQTPPRVITLVNTKTGHKTEVGAGKGIAALKQETTSAPWSADEYIAGLGVLQARELYLKLKEIFGG